MKIDYLLEQFNLFENYKLARQEFSEFASPSEIEDLFKEFKRISGRISDPKQKDINYWRKQGYSSFKKFVDGLTQNQSKRERNREVRTASDEILTVKKTNNMHLFMPLSEDASCFYGYKGDGEGSGGWCISTKSGQNYFYQYTKQMELYIFFLTYENNVYALVIDEYGDIKECQDHRNENSFSPDTFLQISGLSLEDLTRFAEKHKDIIFDNIDKKQKKKYEKLFKTKEALDILKTKDPIDIHRFIVDNNIKARWVEAEPYLMKNPEVALYYAKLAIRGRWKEAEKYIKEYPSTAYSYVMDVIKKRFPPMEPYFVKRPEYAYEYAVTHIDGRWKEAEPYIMKHPEYAAKYALNVIKDRWPEAEKYIITKPETAFYYANYVISDRWLEAEPIIKKMIIIGESTNDM